MARGIGKPQHRNKQPSTQSRLSHETTDGSQRRLGVPSIQEVLCPLPFSYRSSAGVAWHSALEAVESGSLDNRNFDYDFEWMPRREAIQSQLMKQSIPPMCRRQFWIMFAALGLGIYSILGQTNGKGNVDAKAHRTAEEMVQKNE